jgi:2-keto-4-pentenoate hydratase/2-oxohepta-3-ene-1,7-dioic acid hydratase in catechol pathway
VRLATYRSNITDAARLGAVLESNAVDTIVDIGRLGDAAGLDLPASMLDFIDLGNDVVTCTAGLLGDERLVATPRVRQALSNVQLLAPIPIPRKNIWGIGLNYTEHVEESSRSLDTANEMPDKPVIFSKPPTTVCASGDPIVRNPDLTQQLDWEVELAVIIGQTARRIGVQDAMQHVFGYTVLVDVSARDARRSGQWIVSKGQDTYAPMGPWIVTADEIPDPHVLDLWLTKNGETMQSSNTRHMHFKIPDLISDISQGMTLQPGDIIATGTPEGVGAGREPQVWMLPGDRIVAHVEGIGSITNPIVGI